MRWRNGIKNLYLGSLSRLLRNIIYLFKVATNLQSPLFNLWRWQILFRCITRGRIYRSFSGCRLFVLIFAAVARTIYFILTLMLHATRSGNALKSLVFAIANYQFNSTPYTISVIIKNICLYHICWTNSIGSRIKWISDSIKSALAVVRSR